MTSKYERPNHLFKATSQFNANHVFRSDLICSSSVSGPKVLKTCLRFAIHSVTVKSYGTFSEVVLEKFEMFAQKSISL